MATGPFAVASLKFLVHMVDRNRIDATSCILDAGLGHLVEDGENPAVGV